MYLLVADPGFPIGGSVHPLGGGRGPLMWALFSENVCKNERIGSHRGWRAPGTPPRSANAYCLGYMIPCISSFRGLW